MIEKKRVGQLLLPMALGLVSVDVVAERLDTVNVTATRTARTVDQTLASVEIITRKEIEASQASTISELLAGLPGIDHNATGGAGKSTSLYIRGTDSSHLLVLLDGVRIGSATTGIAALEHLPLSQIERIEVVKGPRSHLYGADAIGGVLQIFTRKKQSGTAINGSLKLGSHETSEVSAGFSTGSKSTRVNMQFARFNTDGFDAVDGGDDDDDGYNNKSVTGSVSQRFTNGLQASVSIFRAEGSNEYDDSGNTSDYENDVVQQVIDGKLNASVTDDWDLSLIVGESRDEGTYYKDSVKSGEFNTKRRQVTLQSDLMVNDGDLFTLGIDHYVNEVSGSVDYDESKRDNSALYLQHQMDFDNSNLTIGLRRDNNQAYGKHTTGNVALGVDLNSQVRAIASYGTGFQAPSFNELYYPAYGNPDLDPEESTTVEFGFEGKHGWGYWNFRYYDTRIEKMIFWGANVNQAKIQGIEFKAATDLAGWGVVGSLSINDARDQATDDFLVGRARESARIDISRGFGNTLLNITALAQSKRYSDTANSNKLDGYAIVDLGLTHRLYKGWRVKGSVKNLFDKVYQTNADWSDNVYNTAGREIYISIAYQMD